MGNEQKKDALVELLESGNCDACLDFFHGMPESKRREYHAVVKLFWSRVRKKRFIEDPPGTFTWNPLDGISRVAYFATASGSEIVKAKRTGYPDDQYALAIIADRKPDWVDTWVNALLGESYYWGHWRFIRQLILAGLATKPNEPRYYLGMISGINSRGSKLDLVDELEKSPDLLQEDIWKLFEYDGDGENSLANTERFDKSWIEAFLELMNKGKLARAKLLDAAVGALERDFNHYRAKWFYDFFDRLNPTDNELKLFGLRILGLLGASAPNVASWALNRVHSLAGLGDIDTSTVCHSIEPILRARAKSNVLTALKLLERQAEAKPNDASLVSKTVVAALLHEAADVQKAAFRLIESLSSVQDANENAAVRALVQKVQPSLAASVRVAVAKWLGAEPQAGKPAKASSPVIAFPTSNKTVSVEVRNAESPKLSSQLEALYSIDVLRKNLKAEVLSIPAVHFDGTDILRLNRVRALSPIHDVEDLIDACARVIEDGSLIDNVELCIDGLARMVGSKPANIDQLTAPLLKRVRKLISKGCTPFCGVDPANDLMGLFYAFCTSEVLEPSKKGAHQFCIEFEGQEIGAFSVNSRKPVGFLSSRCLAVARRIKTACACQLLSSPTHAGGWIDPEALVRRVNSWSGAPPDVYDLILAMLRLAPDNRADALKSLTDKSAEWIQAIRHALGAEKVKIGKESAIWAAAARARSPWLDDPSIAKVHPNLGPDTAIAAKVTFQCRTRKSGEFTFHDPEFVVQPAVPGSIDPLLVTVLMHSSRTIGNALSFEMGGFAGRTVGSVRWTATIWPLARESYFASSAAECLANLDWWEAQWQNRMMLEPLIDPCTPLRYAGLHFLCGMLAAKEPGEAGLAIDIAIRTIEDGRLGSDNLGDALALLFQTGLIKPGRWYKALSEISRASQVHAVVIQIALQSCFSNPPRVLPKDSAKLLELLLELSIELGVPIANQPFRAWLSSGTTTGKSARLAKSLLALQENAESREATRRILNQAIEYRIDWHSHGNRPCKATGS